MAGNRGPNKSHTTYYPRPCLHKLGYEFRLKLPVNIIGLDNKPRRTATAGILRNLPAEREQLKKRAHTEKELSRKESSHED
jgi:hypothetical protein